MANDDALERAKKAVSEAAKLGAFAGRGLEDRDVLEAEMADAIRAAVEAERGRLVHEYGVGSPNGDVIDWLYAWLSDPTNGASRAVLQVFLGRGGYKDAGPLLERLQVRTADVC
jgi:hypothetical protein